LVYSFLLYNLNSLLLYCAFDFLAHCHSAALTRTLWDLSWQFLLFFLRQLHIYPCSSVFVCLFVYQLPRCHAGCHNGNELTTNMAAPAIALPIYGPIFASAAFVKQLKMQLARDANSERSLCSHKSSFGQESIS